MGFAVIRTRPPSLLFILSNKKKKNNETREALARNGAHSHRKKAHNQRVFVDSFVFFNPKFNGNATNVSHQRQSSTRDNLVASIARIYNGISFKLRTQIFLRSHSPKSNSTIIL